MHSEECNVGKLKVLVKKIYIVYQRKIILIQGSSKSKVLSIDYLNKSVIIRPSMTFEIKALLEEKNVHDIVTNHEN